MGSICFRCRERGRRARAPFVKRLAHCRIQARVHLTPSATSTIRESRTYVNWPAHRRLGAIDIGRIHSVGGDSADRNRKGPLCLRWTVVSHATSCPRFHLIVPSWIQGSLRSMINRASVVLASTVERTGLCWRVCSLCVILYKLTLEDCFWEVNSVSYEPDTELKLRNRKEVIWNLCIVFNTINKIQCT